MKLLSTALLSATQTGVKIVSAFVILKLIAIKSGTEGVVYLGAYQNALLIMSMLAGALLYSGITALIAEDSDLDKRKRIFSISLVVSLFASLIVAIVVWLNVVKLGELLFSSSAFNSLLMILPAGIFFYVAFGMVVALFNGEREVKKIVLFNIINSIAVVGFTFISYQYLGLVGLLAALFVPQVLMGIYLLYKRRSYFVPIGIFDFYKSKPIYKSLLNFAAMGLAAAISMPLAQIYVRNFISTSLGVHEAGIWQGVSRISEVYLVFITASLSVYLLPKLASTQDGMPLKLLMISVSKLLIPFALLMGIGVFALRDLIIGVLFTSEFNSMRELFLWQVIGDMIKIIAWLYAYVLLARQNLRWFIFGEVFFSFSYVLAVYFFVLNFGVKGSVYAYAFNYFMYLVFVSMVVVKYHLSSSNLNASN